MDIKDDKRTFIGVFRNKKRVYLVNVISFVNRLNLSQDKYDKIKKYSVDFEDMGGLYEKVHFLRIDSIEILLSECGIFVLTERLDVPGEMLEKWIECCKNLHEELNLHEGDCRIRFVYQPDTQLWVYQ